MKFYTMHGCGNRFAIFDKRALENSSHFTPDFVKSVADATGADQIITMEASEKAHALMNIWNKDGCKVEACGNAARCVAWLLMEEQELDFVSLATVNRVLGAERAGECEVKLDMGEPALSWEEIPLSEPMDTAVIDVKIGPVDAPYLACPGAVSMGNPHCVFFVQNPNAFDLSSLGPLVEGHPLFPQGVNVGFASIEGEETISLRVWERGAGLTPACGTGACAALVAAHRRHLIGRRAYVQMEGGTVQITWQKHDNHVMMTGPVALIAEGELPSPSSVLPQGESIL